MTIDELLSGEQILTLAEEDRKEKEDHFCDLIFGLLDCSTAMLFFLPFFGQRSDGQIFEVPLLSLTGIAPYLRAAYFLLITGITAYGILTLALQNSQRSVWTHRKRKFSLFLNTAGTLLFIMSLQPYAASFLFLFLAIKAFILIKKQ